MLLCNLVLSLCEALTLLVSALVQHLEANISEMLRDFHTTDSNFGDNGNGKFLVCLTQRFSIDRDLVTGSKPLLNRFKKSPLLPLWFLVRIVR